MVSPVFDIHYKDYLGRLAGLDFKAIGPAMGGKVTDQGICVSYFNRVYTLSPSGIINDRGNAAGYDTCIVLCRYALMARDRPAPERPVGPDAWAGFRDLKDSGPLTVYFRDNAESAIADTLSGRLPLSASVVQELAAEPPGMDLQYDLALEIPVLPKIPVLVLFNDADGGFVPSCSVLFRPDVERFLDAECIAMAGYRLAQILKKAWADPA